MQRSASLHVFFRLLVDSDVQRTVSPSFFLLETSDVQRSVDLLCIYFH